MGCVDTASLPGEGHEGGVESQWQEEVASGHSSHGQNGDKVGDAPVVWNERRDGKDDHAGNEEQSKEHREFELRGEG